MKIKKKQLGLTLVVILLLLLTFNLTSVIGITARNIEKDARRSQKIDDSWAVSKSINKNIGAMLFYNDTRDIFTFSIYLNHHGFSFGYFFTGGGATGRIEDGVCEFPYDKNGTVLISMNVKEVAKIELDNGIEVTTIIVDSTKPFAEVIPCNYGEITLYNVAGNEVSMFDY